MKECGGYIKILLTVEGGGIFITHCTLPHQNGQCFSWITWTWLWYERCTHSANKTVSPVRSWPGHIRRSTQGQPTSGRRGMWLNGIFNVCGQYGMNTISLRATMRSSFGILVYRSSTLVRTGSQTISQVQPQHPPDVASGIPHLPNRWPHPLDNTRRPRNTPVHRPLLPQLYRIMLCKNAPLSPFMQHNQWN